VILVIDSSANTGAIATIDETGRLHETFRSARDPGFIAQLRAIAGSKTITKVAVATGPGSFTGLRKGVSFGLGLAMGLRIPIVPLPTLELQAARSDEPVTAISDAGRGRFYYLVPGGNLGLGGPADIPKTHPLVGRVDSSGRAALESSGHRFKVESELRSFVEAAADLMKTAREVPYDSLKLEYMQSFSASK
jgi:tRNA A37 threonylcarbamoyladenosine modification protein TsaB